MSELKQCGACPGCAEQCRHDAENPPAVGIEPVMRLEAEKLLGGDGEYAVDFVKPGWLQECRQKGGTFLLYSQEHVARLQAEVERLKSESFEPLYNEVIDDRDKALARNAELEGLLLELRQCNSNEVWPVWAKINAALAEGK